MQHNNRKGKNNRGNRGPEQRLDLDPKKEVEVPAGNLSDVDNQEILQYKNRELPALCESWRANWITIKDPGLSRLADKIEDLHSDRSTTRVSWPQRNERRPRPQSRARSSGSRS